MWAIKKKKVKTPPPEEPPGQWEAVQQTFMCPLKTLEHPLVLGAPAQSSTCAGRTDCRGGNQKKTTKKKSQVCCCSSCLPLHRRCARLVRTWPSAAPLPRGKSHSSPVSLQQVSLSLEDGRVGNESSPPEQMFCYYLSVSRGYIWFINCIYFPNVG